MDWQEMRAAMDRATNRDIVSFLETEVAVAQSEGDEFLVNLYGQAIIEIKNLRVINDHLRAEVQYYQAMQREN